MSQTESKAAIAGVNNDFAEGFEYGYQLADFELLRIQFEVALDSGDVALAEKLAPQLSASMEAVKKSHANMMDQLQLALATISNATQKEN